MKSILVTFILALAGLFTPAAGLHRFYLNKPVSGVFYLLTWGFFGIGTIIDLFRITSMVDDENYRMLLRQQVASHLRPTSERHRFQTAERAILKCASRHDGVLTVPMVARDSELSLQQAEQHLNAMHKNGYCQKDIDEDGQVNYTFLGLRAKSPIF